MKALVLCAGRGSRLRPLTHTRAKASLPVAGRPILQHVLEYLAAHGFDEVGVVIGPQQEDLGRLAPGLSSQRIEVILQQEPRGIAHAVHVARSFLGDEPFLLYLGDNLTDEPLEPALHRFRSMAPAALLLLYPVTNPQAFGVAEVAGERVLRVVEKPQVPPSNLAVAGLYLFSPLIHQAIATLKPSARGELEITDAIAQLLAWQQPVLSHQIQGWWLDTGTTEGLLAANAHLLERIGTQIDPSAQLEDVTIEGAVQIGPDAVLKRVHLRGPLVIGGASHLTDSIVGPYTSMGERIALEQAVVENSILLPNCRLEGPSLRVADSLVGAGAEIAARDGGTATLLVGDDSHLFILPDRR